jgi:hypothetical protein
MRPKLKKQEIKEQHQENILEKPLPLLKLSEEERTKFIECVVSGEPFCKEFSFGEGEKKFTLVIRDKTKRENEIISRALDRAMDAKKIINYTEYTHAYNMASLYYQIGSINGVEHVAEYPENIYAPFDLLSEMEKSPIAEWSSAQTYIAFGFMTQLNQAILRTSQEAFETQNFS